MSASGARLKALGAAALFSTGGAAVKTAAFTAAQIACFRSGVAAVALLLWARGRFRWSPQMLVVGLVYAATLDLYVAATKLTTAANAIFLQSTSPLYLLILGHSCCTSACADPTPRISSRSVSVSRCVSRAAPRRSRPHQIRASETCSD